MDFEVHVSKKNLAAFRRRVCYHFRKRPKVEYMEAIFIRQDGNQFYIDSFHRLWIEKRTRYAINSSDIQYQELTNQATALGLAIGTIHTHTVSDSAPSRFDITTGVESGEPLMGICEITDAGKRLSLLLDFWIPQMPGKIHQIRK